MNSTRRAVVALLLALTCAPSLRAGQAESVATAPSLTQDQMADFLLKARIGSLRNAGKGVTNSKRATLTDGTFSHDAHIQTVDIAMTVFQAGRHSETNFKDTFRFNIAAYRLARLLGVNVPVSVERRVNGAVASVTWWVDDVAMDEEGRNKKKTLGPNPTRTSEQLSVRHLWDELIQNKDRNQGNTLWTKDFTMWLIDHTRAFRLGREIQSPASLMRTDRDLLSRLRTLTPDAVAQAVGDSLKKNELEAVLARRDAIVTHFDARIARVGEANVLFTSTP